MKHIRRHTSIILLAALISISCTGNRSSEPGARYEPDPNVLISKIEISLDGGQTRLPLGEYTYNEDSQIEEAKVWRYDKKPDGSIDDTEYKYIFEREGNDVNVTKIKKVEDIDYAYFYKLDMGTDDKVDKKVIYDWVDVAEVVRYEWNDDDQLLKRENIAPNVNDDVTYIFHSPDGNIEYHTNDYTTIIFPYINRRNEFENDFYYSYNTDRRNVYSLYPHELSAVGLLSEEYPELEAYLLAAPYNEVEKYVMDQKSRVINRGEDLVYNTKKETTNNYIYEYGDNEWPSKIVISSLQHHQAFDHQNPDNNEDSINVAYNMLYFSYIEK